jgi:hypothetical protein
VVCHHEGEDTINVDELYDWQYYAVKHVVTPYLQQRFASRPNTQANLAEFSKYAVEAFRKIGLAADVNLMPCMFGESPEVVVIRNLAVDDHDGYDHERKRWEVLLSKSKGEDYLGQKDGNTGK